MQMDNEKNTSEKDTLIVSLKEEIEKQNEIIKTQENLIKTQENTIKALKNYNDDLMKALDKFFNS